MKRFVTRATPVFIVLVGCISCSSFNNSFNTYHGLPAQPIKAAEPEEPTLPEVIVTQAPPVTPPLISMPLPKARCDVSPFPVYPKTPEAPGKEMQEATDLKTVEHLERKYIKDLLNYISDLKKRQRDQEFKFSDKCTSVLK